MNLKEKIKAYVIKIIREETEELKNREILLEENVRNLNAVMEGYSRLEENIRNLNAAIEGQEVIAENVRNLNTVMEGYSRLEENIRNLNAAIEGQEAIVENVRNLNAVMEGYSRLEENIRNLNATIEAQKAIAENVRNLNAEMEGYRGIVENVKNLNASMKEQKTIAENVQNLNAMVAEYSGLAENVRNLNATMEVQEALVEDYGLLKENVRNLNATMEVQDTLAENVQNLNSLLQDYEKVIENQKKNTSLIEKLQSTLEMQKVKLAMFEKEKGSQHGAQAELQSDVRKVEHEVPLPIENLYSGIDYFDFENYFRGSMQLIKRNQQQYIKYYKGKSNVVDLGCGRGEFLELLGENGINAKGVDLYEEFAEMCRMHGLDVVCDDALLFLEKQQKVGGIFAGQLIEHLTVNQLVELCRLAYEKLEDGAYIVMETPNPTCLAIYSHAFYIDPSHNKPVHPLTVKYILEKSGFMDIEIIYTDTSKLPVCIPAISGIEDADKFNDAMQMVSEVLFGSQDYAAIARKHSNELRGCCL